MVKNNIELEKLILEIDTTDILLENLSVNSPIRLNALNKLYELTYKYYKLTGYPYKLRDDGK